MSDMCNLNGKGKSNVEFPFPSGRESRSKKIKLHDPDMVRNTKNRPAADDHKAHLKKFLRWIAGRHAKHGGVTEIRILQDQPIGAVFSGYFDLDHSKELIDQLLPEDRERVPFGEHPRIGEANIYVCLHPAKPELLARSAYSFHKCPATADADIVAFDLVLIDIDPVRASGISATKEEKLAAKAVRDKIKAWLAKRGITSISGDSGNGYHLLIPTIPYSDVADASERTKLLLQLLDKKFSIAGKVKIDTGVANPARISKVYGSKAMKGSDISDRPHRYAKVWFPKKIRNIDLFEILKKELADFRKERESQSTVPATSKVRDRGTDPTRNGRTDWDQERRAPC